MRSSELWAHCDEPLHEHLEAVGHLAETYAPAELKEDARLAGLTHDIGKATTFFQQYLRAKCMDQRFRPSPETHHAYLSAVFGAWVARVQDSRNILAVFLAIARHHSNLRSPTELTASQEQLRNLGLVKPPALRRELRALQRQLGDLKKTPFHDLCQRLKLPEPTPFLEGEAWEVISDLHQIAKDINLRSETRGDYWTINRLFSCLIDSDKKLAARIHLPERLHIPVNLVDDYVITLPTSSKLTPLRQTLYRGVDDRMKVTALEDLFPAQLTLKAPTGSGKTLTAMNGALKLRGRVETETGTPPRIVYVLPFINLIEQNYRVLCDVLKTYPLFIKNPRGYLTQHHYLACTGEGGGEKDLDSQSIEERLLLTEAWDSEIVVTTFVQLFQTLVGYRNRYLKKLHNIENSIVILDEVQSLPAEHWHLVRKVLTDLKALNCTVISMSATLPELLSEVLELAPEFPQWPHRVRIRRHTIESQEELIQAVASENARSQLVVVNTVACSIEIHNALRERGVSSLFYLSTNVTPFERRKRIETIRESMEEGEPVILVATQVVEAGVDLDFSIGYREMGPLDSIVQVAGRVNRGNDLDVGTLHILEFDKSGANKVYGRILPELSKKLLPNDVSDTALTPILEDYYAQMEERVSHAQSGKILDCLERLRYDDSRAGGISSFALFKELPSVDIFVELNEDATRIRENLEKAFREKEFGAKRAKLRKLWPLARRFMISTFPYRAKGNPPPPLFPEHDSEGIHHVTRDDLSVYYEVSQDHLRGTGFKWAPENDIEGQII